jgi:hypothetical protein
MHCHLASRNAPPLKTARQAGKQCHIMYHKKENFKLITNISISLVCDDCVRRYKLQTAFSEIPYIFGQMVTMETPISKENMD